MQTIHVNTQNSYDVLVGNNILSQVGSYTKKVTDAQTVVIVSDSNVWPLYGDTVLKSLQESDFNVAPPYVIPADESSKNGFQFLNILEHLAASGLTRSDCVIALGGGVTGDICGFAAACYLRGIDYIQIPTTLLACVDSSVGGKTAIDLSCGKNLAGAFHQPALVICDTAVLDTLPTSVFRDGCAEIIKYALLFDSDLFAHLQDKGTDFDKDYVVSRCIELKRDAVVKDEFDRGVRNMLNFGHTVGHSLEAISNYSLSHGKAVSIGMAVMTRSSSVSGLCDETTASAVISLLQQFGLPIHSSESADIICQKALLDKKRSNNSLKLVLPRCIGKCDLITTPIDDLKSVIEAGL